MKKINEKFSQLMSFNLDKKSGVGAHNTGFTNNMSALDNMRLNQTRFKNALSSGFKQNQAEPRHGSKKVTNKPFRVRFSLDRDSAEHNNATLPTK